MPATRKSCALGSSAPATDILFLFCPYSGHPPPHRFDINLGAAYLAAYLDKEGVQSAFYHGAYDNDPDFGQVLESIAEFNPRAIGFSVYGSNLPETAALSRAIKQTYPIVPIIWGGAEIRYRPQRIIRSYGPCVDVCISGEGEKPLLKLLRTPMPWNDSILAAIPGVCFQSPKDGKITFSPPDTTILQDASGHRPQCALDVYPSPYLSGIVPSGYFRDKTVVSILTSRGCPFKCVYCQFSALNEHRVHFHSVDRVVAEIEWIHNAVLGYHPHKDAVMIMIYDEALTLSRRRTEALCRSIVAHNFDPPVRFWIDTRADCVDERLLGLLKTAGAKKINFGLESAVPQVLKKIGKVPAGGRRTPDDVSAEARFLQRVQQAVKASKNLGLFTSVSIIVGLPTERLAEARQTLRFVRELKVDLYYHNFLNVLEGTQLEENAAQLGYQWDLYPLGYMGKYGHRYTRAPIATRSIPPLKNAMVFDRDRRRFGVLLRGWEYASKFAGESSAPALYRPFVLGIETPDDPLGQQRSVQNAGLSTTLLCPKPLSESDQHIAALLSRLPLKNARFHRMPAKDNTLDRIQGIEEADHSTPYVIAFSNLKGFHDPDDGRRVFCTVDNRNDFQSLARFFATLKSTMTVPLPHDRALELAFDLFESCRWFRWFKTACPAALLTHLYEDKEHCLRPCVHFAALNAPGEALDIEQLRGRVLEHINKTKAQRGCHDCAVNTRCPQCSAPFPLSDTEYCAHQKDYFSEAQAHPGG